VGFGTPLSLVIGLILIGGGLALFFLGNIKPDIKRDSDNVYAILAIIAGILGVISFNKEIVPSMEQLLLAGMAIFLMWENIQKRTPNPEARREFTSRDDSPRRPYRADRVSEYEEFGGRGGAGLRGDRGGYDDRSDRSLPRRDRDDDRGSRRGGYGDDFGGGPSRRDEPPAPRRIPGRSGGRDEADRGRGDSSRGDSDRSDFGRGGDFDNEPGRSDMGRAREARGYGNSNEFGDDPPAPRRRPNRDDAPPRRRRSPDRVEDVNNAPEDIPDADYVDFTPVESENRPSGGSSWGPQ
jgi:hypothetical protein